MELRCLFLGLQRCCYRQAHCLKALRFYGSRFFWFYNSWQCPHGFRLHCSEIPGPKVLDFIFLEPGVLSVEDCRFLNSKDSRHEGSKTQYFSSLTV